MMLLFWGHRSRWFYFWRAQKPSSDFAHPTRSHATQSQMNLHFSCGFQGKKIKMVFRGGSFPQFVCLLFFRGFITRKQDSRPFDEKWQKSSMTFDDPGTFSKRNLDSTCDILRHSETFNTFAHLCYEKYCRAEACLTVVCHFCSIQLSIFSDLDGHTVQAFCTNESVVYFVQ